MNRPYGAVDVSANLKGAVPKAATQKILVALAEKGELIQKTYGKTTFFVANQANLESVPPEKLAALEVEYKKIDEENKIRGAEVKALITGKHKKSLWIKYYKLNLRIRAR
jgi:26S proteasome regulatory subunit (ATPase 3-interacting protein)